jgi:hypothetical protein
MLNLLQSAAAGEKAVFATKNLVTKRKLGPHLCIFRRAGGQARKPRYAPEAALKRPASCSPSLFSPSLIPIFRKRQFEKKKLDLNGRKHPTPPTLDTTGLSRWGARAGKSTLGEQLLVARRLAASECRCCATLHTLH